MDQEVSTEALLGNTQGRKLGLWTPEFPAYYGSDIKIGTGEVF